MQVLLRTVPFVAVLFLTGCGGQTAPHPTTEVTAIVTYQGNPVEGATLTFVNEDHGSPITAVGRTDAQGVAKMKTFAEGDGAVQGTHRVSILKFTEAAPQPESGGIDSESYDPFAAGKTEAPKPLLPLKYSSANSGLTLEVGDTPVEHRFDLVD